MTNTHQTLVVDLYFFGGFACFLVDWPNLSHEQELVHPLLLMSSTREFFNTLESLLKR